jgi:hypothetical protein
LETDPLPYFYYLDGVTSRIRLIDPAFVTKARWRMFWRCTTSLSGLFARFSLSLTDCLVYNYVVFNSTEHNGRQPILMNLIIRGDYVPAASWADALHILNGATYTCFA